MLVHLAAHIHLLESSNSTEIVTVSEECVPGVPSKIELAMMGWGTGKQRAQELKSLLLEVCSQCLVFLSTRGSQT